VRLISLDRHTVRHSVWRRPGSQVPLPWYFVAQNIHSLWLRLVLERVSGGKLLTLLRFVGVLLVKYSFQKGKPRG
jgi:hypothetical protein